MAERDARIDRLLLGQEIADFLYREAELLDQRRYREWLDLLAEDIRYWMPMRRNVKYGDTAREFTREGEDISWFDEGKDTLTRRVRVSLPSSNQLMSSPSRVNSRVVSPYLTLRRIGIQ